MNNLIIIIIIKYTSKVAKPFLIVWPVSRVGIKVSDFINSSNAEVVIKITEIAINSSTREVNSFDFWICLTTSVARMITSGFRPSGRYQRKSASSVKKIMSVTGVFSGNLKRYMNMRQNKKSGVVCKNENKLTGASEHIIRMLPKIGKVRVLNIAV